MTELNILVIHGMGSQERYYSHPMRDEINERLGPEPAGRVSWGEAYWADVLKERQTEYFNEARQNAELDFISMRRFMVHSVADASAYRRTEDEKDTVYGDIHAKVTMALKKLDDPDEPQKPLVVMAHSLGAHIMSNYIWDLQKPGAAPAGASDFLAMRTLAGMITFGCNIPFFTFAYRKSEIKPIAFPGSALAPALRERARWLNFYDPDDVLGYPLRPINYAYRKVVDEDIAINVGGLTTSWNPLSHSHYWYDNDFTVPVTDFLRSLLEA